LADEKDTVADLSPSQGAGRTVAILGGTGGEGTGLALRWARAGYTILIGSRQREKAEQVAAQLREGLPAAAGPRVSGLSNEEAARRVDIAVLTVPYKAHAPTLTDLRDELQGKILVDVTVPLQPPQVNRIYLPEEGPVAVQAQQILGPGVRVVAAFHHVGEHFLRDPERLIDCDVLVCGDDAEAKAAVMELAEALGPGVRALDGGALVNASGLESLTPILIGLGKQFRRLRVGIRFTGIGDW
jgi:NADPH-dependent F420 reductase